MVLAGDSREGSAAPRSLKLALILAGALALVAAGAPAASAGPAEEEYKLNLPNARGGDSSSPGEARSRLGGGPGASPSGSSPSGSSVGGTSYRGAGSAGYGTSGRARYGTSGWGTGNDGASSGGASSGYDELLAKARGGAGDSGALSAATTAAGKTPLGLAVIAALLLITLAGLLAVRRSRRIKGINSG